MGGKISENKHVAYDTDSKKSDMAGASKYGGKVFLCFLQDIGMIS